MKRLNASLIMNRHKKQYVGHTADIFMNQWNNHTTFDRGGHYIQGHLYRYFMLTSQSPFLHKVFAALVDKEDY